MSLRVAQTGEVGHHATVSGSANLGSGEVPTPQVVAAWTRLGVVPTETVPLWAAHWLTAGHDGEALVSLAGLHGDNRYDVLDALPGALKDCGIQVPASIVAAASVAFADLARTCLDGRIEPLTVVQLVDRILRESGHHDGVLDLPLAAVYTLDDEWGQGWGRPAEQLTAVVREACEEQLSTTTTAT
jgi:hypothetical protein